MQLSRRLPLSRKPPPAAALDAADRSELRCRCGSLLARFAHGTLELKCRRCKRVIRVRLAAGAAFVAVTCDCAAGG